MSGINTEINPRLTTLDLVFTDDIEVSNVAPIEVRLALKKSP